LVLVAAKSSRSQTAVDIHNFTGNNGSAIPLHVTPMQGRDGRLYGTTGGLGSGTSYGTIFKISSSGAFQQLHTFGNFDGSQPNAGVTLASDGTFYGTTLLGGDAGLGVLFRISQGGTYTVLHNFEGSTDGAAPAAPPIDGFDGSLYGTTSGNATTASTIYKYTRASGTIATIYVLSQTEGSTAIGSLLRATDGNLYGTAYQGGNAGCGTIFKVSTSGTPLWNYSFPCQPGGAHPIAPLIQGTDGNFYGTTYQGGTYNEGIVFKLTQSGVVSTLYNFQGLPFNSGNDGSYPVGGLVQSTDLNFYGSTQGGGGTEGHGTLFEISPSGTYKQLYIFTNVGENPESGPVQDTSGLFYGTTSAGGKYGYGIVYSLNVGLAPFVALGQYQGKIGGTAQILGEGFTGTTGVTFNGVSATSFSVVSDTYMTAVVPAGATTGTVVVTTPSGKLRSNKNFRILGGVNAAVRTKSVQPIFHTPKKAN
jgi:uncharacterized repeat protein (TIGR03803 family)